ncbi:ABC transporter family substrate-binding protein [Streptomyces sp. NPDC090306]|uniref:ABC transporter family substrate-binding protein n=1 Tax=Streptomyces sp. NPDC090306 TaxID=3365961 RepID=UPI0037F4D38D
MSHDGVGLRAVMRSVAFLTAGALAVPVLTACGSDDRAGRPTAAQDIDPAARGLVADGGTLRWAVDAMPETLNTFQADADNGSARIAQAVLPSLYRVDENGRPQVNPDYLEKAKVTETQPKQVVVYKLNQQAVWSDGREIGAADFAAQWRALSGKDTSYWTARNAGYDRIEKVEQGANALEVKVTFSRPYADWKSLFTPLYPKSVMGTPDSFNDGARRKLKITAGPFAVGEFDSKGKDVTLTRNPRWWGSPAKLSKIELHAVPRDERAEALADGTVDIADVDPSEAKRVTSAAQGSGAPLSGPAAGRTAAKDLRSWARAHGSDEDEADDEVHARKKLRRAIAAYEGQQKALRGFEIRKSLEPAYTQLALNGSDGPLADERVRRAVARAIDRKQIAAAVLKPLGLPAVPVGSHLALSGQAAYADSSGAIGAQDTAEAQALLADAGWVPGGPLKSEKKKGDKAAGAKGEKTGKDEKGAKSDKDSDESEGGDEGTYIVGEDNKGHDGKADDGDGRDGKGAESRKDSQDHQSRHQDQQGGRTGESGARQLAQEGGHSYANGNLKQGGAPGAYAPQGTAAPAAVPAGPLAKDGKPLTLRFVLPSGPGSDTLRTVADRITAMLEKVGIHTDITKVSDESYFTDHIASGQYDLALYSWPGSAFPATDARPVYAKPVPAADGSLNVEQNYTRVGTDQVDQLFDQALGTLDEDRARSLLRKADSRIWAAAASIPLYQRPQLTAVRKNLVNAGAFGFQTPVFENMGFLKKGARPAGGPSPS